MRLGANCPQAPERLDLTNPRGARAHCGGSTFYTVLVRYTFYMRNPKAKIGERERSEILQLLELAGKEHGVIKKIAADLFTPAELNEFAARWQIIKRLTRGESQRKIAQDLHVGIATVVRGARALANSSGGFAWILRRKS